MQLCQLAFFDLGVSYGLDDGTFRPTPAGTTNVPDILGVGISNPLGEGVTAALDAAVVKRWQDEAVRMVHAPDMELGLDRHAPDFATFQSELAGRIAKHPVRASVTVFAIGTALLHIELDPGIELPYLMGFDKCYEFAAYSRHVSDAIVDAARRLAEGAVRPGGERLRALTRREPPVVQKDEHGREESRLLNAYGFSRLALCLDPSDDVDAIQRALFPPRLGATTGIESVVGFDYHGELRFAWSGCLLVPKDSTRPPADVRDDIRRMLACVRIAHSFLGAATAFESLLLEETRRQADSFLRGGEGGLGARNLNRLRTLAEAVVSLTNYAPVAAADEDQNYFRCFEKHARIAERHQLIQARCEILYNVQQAETQAHETRRERRLSAVLFILAGLTCISVLADSYNFVKDDEKHLVGSFFHRLEIVLGLIVGVVVILLSLIYYFQPGSSRDDS
jgi:hypothetical protein